LLSAAGKWSEGLDYRGEFLAGAMVIGLPLAPYNRVRQMTMDYYRHKLGAEGEFISYTLPALNRAQQAIGRVIRIPMRGGCLSSARRGSSNQGSMPVFPPGSGRR